jgi:cysteine desulfurase
MTSNEAYLDNNATTRPFDEAIEAAVACLKDGFGNPSSSHAAGERARKIVDGAREAVAELLTCRPTEIVFTSCATESTNAALRAAVLSRGRDGRPTRIVRTAVEHEAVVETCRALALSGAETTALPVDGEGRLDLDAARAEIRDDVAVVAAMFANNETGALFPIAELAAICRAKGVPLFVDAVQAVGKVGLDVEAWGCDYVALSGHKFHAPKGVGVLYVRRGARFRPLLFGGPQEGRRRAGTENTPGIAALGVAAARMARDVEARRRRLAELSARIESELLRIPRSHLNAAGAERVPGVSNVSFEGIEGSAVVATVAREGVCVSAGSACGSTGSSGSHVLEAMGLPYARVQGAVRVSCAETTTDAEVDRGVAAIKKAVAALRRLDPGVVRSRANDGG